MSKFFFPCLIISPAFDGETIRIGDFAVHKRLWQTGTFDLATLATKHRLHLAYQIMDVFLAGTACELEIEATGIEDATVKADIFKTMLYLNGITPFLMPFATSHSVNAYSGINSRDSEFLTAQLPAGLRSGLTSAATTIEAWPHELTFFTINHGGGELQEDSVRKAVWQFQQWTALEPRQPRLRLARLALQTAPMVQHLGSSLLHIWQGIETLFPEVSAEVSFRLSLLVAQLGSPLQPSSETYRLARASYGQRSRIAHGNEDAVGIDTWTKAWDLLILSLKAVIHRRQLPSEAQLIAELFENQKFVRGETDF